MARIRRLTTVCDLPQYGDVSADRALFVLTDRIYTVDACPQHKAELRAAVARLTHAIAAYQANARKRQDTRNRPRQTLRLRR